ncbi:hypothetical protein TEA_008394 [Camellia sinensis var. sinensis]|uniref:Heparan-alpha-glucosaminide N-acetyltransferase catalytic domain-containing protein n=1 Tax=Camellia sinensis var. sinensis TaxID=542762 RepID=A0A4S4EQJ8_CAMSN|nr:hypothetical protein TEA_008394 [Camellia sinensis var. sinensis]
MDIWLVNNIVVDSALAFVKRYYIQWMVAFLLGSLYMCLLYGLYVPNWKYEVPSTNSSSSTSRYGFDSQVVHCGMRGSLQPPCNAVGLVDRFFLGVQHLYQHPVYRRTKECSVNSPDYGPLPLNSPEWCLAPFDPEGILRADLILPFAISNPQVGIGGKQAGNGHRQRVFWWSISSFPLLISGYVLKVLGIPFSKPLYTLSYMCITAGASGFLLTIIFYIVDVNQVKKPTMVLQWMGMNALIIYALGACDLFPAALQGFYWRSPENNLFSYYEPKKHRHFNRGSASYPTPVLDKHSLDTPKIVNTTTKEMMEIRDWVKKKAKWLENRIMARLSHGSPTFTLKAPHDVGWSPCARHMGDILSNHLVRGGDLSEEVTSPRMRKPRRGDQSLGEPFFLATPNQ